MQFVAPSSRSLVTLAVAAAVALAVAQAPKVKITPAPKVGPAKYKYEMSTSLNGMDVVMKADFDFKITAIENGLVTLGGPWTNMSLSVAGQEPAVETTPTAVTYVAATGEIKKASGGVQGTDEQRTYILLHFVPPTTEIGEGESYTVDFAGSKADSMSPYKYIGTYVGKAEFMGKPALKFTAKISEKGADTLTADSTFLVLEDATILQAESKFKNLPLPQFGATLDGKAKLVRAE